MDSIRIEEYKQLLKLTENNFRVTTILEALCFEKSVKFGTLHDIPVWQYSTGTTLFETDKNDVHCRELLASYYDSLQELKCKLLLPEIKKSLINNPYSMQDVEAHTKYGEWKEKYYEGITQSRKILEEKQEDQGTFIQCKKCKSSAVDTEQKQTRSADEPMTIFCCCRKCGTRFRID